MEYFIDTFVNKRVGVGLNTFNTVILGTVGTTMLTFAVLPSVLAAQIAQVALCIIKTSGHTILTIGLFGAIERAATHLGGEIGTGDAEDLPGHDVVDTLLQVGDLLFETRQQPFRNLAQEDAALAAGIEKPRIGTAEQLLRQQVEHTVGQLGRGEDFVAGKVCQAVEDIWAISPHTALRLYGVTTVGSLREPQGSILFIHRSYR